MGNTREQAWQWLLPPVVAGSDGKLLPRSRSRARSFAPSDPGPGSLKKPNSPAIPVKPWSETQVQADLLLDFFAQAPTQTSSGEVIQTDFAEAEKTRLPDAGFSDAAQVAGRFAAGLEDAADQAPYTPQVRGGVLRANDLLVHPDANQQVQLKGHCVQYLLRRSNRRSIGFTVGMQGLVVTAPQWVSLQQTQAALVSKARWIVDKLQELQQRHAQSEAARIQWCDGGQIDFLGQSMGLRLAATPGLGTRAAYRQVDSDGRSHLCLPVAPGTAAMQVRATVKAWVLREARTHFVTRLEHFAPVMGVQWQALRLTSARTRWGSANTDGVIRLNWRLMQHVPDVIDYVVVHELAHLHHMDHSPQFWAVVASILPDWQKQRQALKDRPLPPWE